VSGRAVAVHGMLVNRLSFHMVQMWLPFVLAALGVGLAALLLGRLLWRRPRSRSWIDVGTVSESWLAEQRAASKDRFSA